MKLMPLLLLFAACGDDGTPAPEGCQPLLAGECMLPYPSDFFRVPDAKMPSGFHIALQKVAEPKDNHNVPMDPFTQWQPDGFSKVPLIVATLQVPLSHDGLVGILDDFGMAATPQSRTILLEASSGKLLPHYVDIDTRESKPNRQPLIIYPANPLAARTRYIVALQNITTTDGQTAPAPAGFRKLRDKQVDGSVTGIAAHYESDIFAPLVAAGIPRGSLQLAWDFTTGSDERAQADMLHVRELTLAWLDANPVQVTVDSVDENPQSDIWRTIKGNITVPLFMENPDAGAKLFRGPDGQVAQNGTTQLPYIANVPVSLMNGTNAGRALAYGHGFFGTRDECNAASTRHIADRLGVTMFCIDWWGMSTPDVGKLAGNITGDAQTTFVFSDRVHQGIANWLVMTAAIRGPLATQQMGFHRPDGSAVYDPTVIYYLGISEGHILGGVMTALNPDIGRLVLNVGGASWGHMLFRALPMAPLIKLMDTIVPDGLVEYEFIALGRSLLDRMDPVTYAPYLLTGGGLARNPPARHVLIETGLGDDEVINASSFLQARLLGIPQLSPNAYAGWGVPQMQAPLDSAIAVWDFGIDLTYYNDPIPLDMENGVHEGLRKLDTAIDMMDMHLRPGGMIVNTCGGVCTSAH